jgi:two-component system LytT family response regulator
MVAMLRAYIVDDERLAVQRLTRLIEASGRVEIAGSTTDPEEALAYLRRHEVDVLFLDIQMPGLSGFELLEQLEQTPVVIFTTAFDRYAIDAFAANSIDYLLKPIEPERLDRALAKLERLSGTGARRPEGDPSPLRDIRALARELAVQLAPGRRLERVASRVGERTTVIEVARVTHFFSKDKLTFAAANGRDHVVDFTMVELEAKLDPRRFLRIHRATIVNVAFVRELDTWVDSGVIVRLRDDKKTELAVARDRVRELKERLGI